MTTGKKGLFDLKTVKNSGLPIFDFTSGENPGIFITFWTYTDLKEIGWNLNVTQRETMIRGFVKTSNRMRGYASLYDFCEMMEVFYGYKPTYIKSK
ncbi:MULTISPECIES: hypothetical protein [Bacillus]|nr:MULTISPECIES: hypothetical protein [Bacillus]MCY7499157.1 hypothetical protein [Bacillus altitudinis]MCY7537177.1 hypothetical protein [Bacillus altitudinis]MCY7548649.1 hypothetical protein [Bacillus altitudinis]MCY7555589.1 hypothetical protein [Bacillus altitudinis]MCY7591697.1 hypothetical protein [Bacillus altitudinis]